MAEVTLSEEERAMLAKELNVAAEKVPLTFRKGVGCPECDETGYHGRVGIFELLRLDEKIQQAIMEGAGRTRIVADALSEGMITLRMDGLDKVRQGITTYEEVLRVTR